MDQITAHSSFVQLMATHGRRYFLGGSLHPATKVFLEDAPAKIHFESVGIKGLALPFVSFGLDIIIGLALFTTTLVASAFIRVSLTWLFQHVLSDLNDVEGVVQIIGFVAYSLSLSLFVIHLFRSAAAIIKAV